MKFKPLAFLVTTVLLVGACASDEPSTIDTSGPAGTAKTSTPSEPATTTTAVPAVTPTPTTTAGTELATEDSATSATTVAGDLRPEFDAFVQAQSEINGFIGSVLVARGDEVIFEAGYGEADIESGTPNSPATIHRVGSIAKGFTAALVLSLQEAGELRVNDTIDRYLPDFPRGDEITVQQLLTHTSGVFNYTDDPDLVARAASEVSIDDLIATFADRPLVFEPGASWSYSNSGYVLLARIIEVVSESSYADFLQQTIAIPLDLEHTATESVTDISPDRSKGYVAGASGFEPAVAFHPSVAVGAGDIVSTVGDLYTWDRALMTGSFLSDESRAILFATDVKPDPTLDGAYGAGWVIDERFGRTVIEHDGGIPGYAAMHAFYPDDDLVVVALSNNELGPSPVVAEGLAAIAFDEPYVVPTSVDVPADVLAGYAGEYDLDIGEADPLRLTVTVVNGSLVVQAAGQAPLQGVAQTDTSFSFVGGTIIVTFEPGDRGTSDTLTLEQGGQEFAGVRVSP